MRNKRGHADALCNFFYKNRKGQVTIFIIIAIMIVAGVALFFLIRQNISIVQIPPNLQPVYDTFLSCIEDDTLTGINVLGSQGGYIDLPEFELGSNYMPFSSQLNLMGNMIPYWYYISGNNIEKEQIPSKKEMEENLGRFIDSRIANCDFSGYYSQGFEIELGESKASPTIQEDNIDVKLRMNLRITRGNDTILIQNHNANVKSRLGSLYESAIAIYQKEQRELFLENYGIDNLRLYAPVDGVALSCSPKIWSADNVFAELKESIETNTLALSTELPITEDGKYFYVDADIADSARFINSQSWPSTFEVLPAEGNLLIANPVGNQEGLGVLGFCYVPYHFVYNVKYPVLVQVYNGDEIFQFPLAVVIQGNKARQALNATAFPAESADLCPYKNTFVSVRTIDSNLNPVNASIYYECFGESCEMGDTLNGELSTEFPQCVNGFILAKANGFKDARYQYTTTIGGSAEIMMDRLYKRKVQLKLGNINSEETALIYFSSEGFSKTISYPEQKEVELATGNYKISVYAYGNSSIQLDATTSQQCAEVPSSGIGGVLGFKEKKCFDVEIPSQLITNAIIGGGNTEIFISESELENANSIEINAQKFSVPKTVLELQNNYLALDESDIEVRFI